jgi:pimeloyl-ACP methyl ester carboxylesterase
MQTIRGVAAGVPFTVRPPVDEDSAPVVLAWHLMDAPSTDAAFAAALPLAGLDAWKVYFGMPWCGERHYPEGLEISRREPMMAYLDPVVRQASSEYAPALAELRERFGFDGPVGVMGGSLGGAVALSVAASGGLPVAAVAIVNAAIRASTVVELIESMTGNPYEWNEASRDAAGRLDFLARVGELPPATLVVSGAEDLPGFKADAAALADALPEGKLVTIPGLEHHLAERPGTEPAPQLPQAVAVDAAMSEWFVGRLR